MHPWMNPRDETRLWPHENAEVYRAYDRIFDCRAHGWANLQSTHINLPFGDDREFARLHAAVRFALPILPAIAAASPFVEGRAALALDQRLEAYRHNAAGVPAMNGAMIPEPMASRAQYERELLRPLYQALAPHDPHRVLRAEWANARGAIARFDRSALEIRVVDVQECPAADVALAAAIIDLVWLFYREPPRPASTAELAAVFRACVRDADQARIDSAVYGAGTARDAWKMLSRRMSKAPHRELWERHLALTLEEGPLARRMLQAVGRNPSRHELAGLYAKLCECLEQNRIFGASTS
jgi:gamma-glutamyl:cysteine ligase YbdK (ATP-grasp superfamily)